MNLLFGTRLFPVDLVEWFLASSGTILVSTAGKINDMAFEQWIWSTAATIAAEAQEDDADLFLSHGRELANPSQEGKAAVMRSWSLV